MSTRARGFYRIAVGRSVAQVQLGTDLKIDAVIHGMDIDKNVRSCTCLGLVY